MNTPRNIFINPDDPKWTAYVLGELEGDERAEIERLLETSEEARALVEELTIATTSMKEELTSLLPLMMTPEQRAAIRTAAKPAPKRWFEMFPSRWGLGLAAAAILVMAVVLPFAWQPAKETEVAAVQPEARDSGLSALAVPPQITIIPGPPAQAKVVVPRSEDKAEVRPTNSTAGQVLSQQELAKLTDGTPQTALSGPAAPQVVLSGALGGVVADATRAAIPGVRITATNSGTGVVLGTTTNESGAYNFSSLAPGTYQVSAVLPGFQSQTVTNLPVKSQVQIRVDYTLQVSPVNTSIEVQVSAAELLAGAPASVGQVLTQQQVANLPLVGNDVQELVQVMPLSPGVNFADVQSGQSQGRQGQQGQQFQQRLQSVQEQESLQALQRTAQQGQGQQGQQGQGQGGRGNAGGPQAGVAQGTAGGSFNNTTRDGISPTDNRLIVSPAVGAAPVATQPPPGGPPAASPRPSVAAPPPPPPPPAPVMAPALAAPAITPDRINAPAPNTEAYDRVTDNPFIRTTQENLATFSIDVDTASYANVRRFLNQNQLPPRDAVRIEELINYFSYDYAQPTGSAPIAPNMEVAAAPWHPTNRLVRIGIKARDINANRRPPSNLVFLIDVSGSMNTPEKLPLVKAGLGMLVERLSENDLVSIVVYAGNSGLVLSPTNGLQKERIRQAIDGLQPGGSTNGGSGIQLAYNQATANFMRGGVNRVVLMTDGDFNVGVTNQGDLTRLIEDRARSGVFLSVLGFGMGNYKDSTLEKLADQGNGNYAYIDNLAEARKVLVEEMSGTLVTVAKDVKIQVDFNPARVEAYRLIGYENRVLRTEDFNNDAKDAGDMGAGHTVTALFEVVPKGGEVPGPSVDPSKYTQAPAAAGGGGGGRAAAANVGASSNEMLTLRVRYKLPDSDTSTRMDVPLVDRGGTFARATTDFRFAASVAEFGMVLRNSPYRGSARMDSVMDIAGGSVGADRNGYRKEFISLVQRARNLIR